MKSMSLRNRLLLDEPCASCGFELWEPIAESTYSKLGLYNDDRFPGRSILALREHRVSIESIPMDTLMGFMREIQIAMNAIKIASGAERVNVAIMGNRDAHVHAHLIPRFPALEEFPDCSPWNDQRIKGKLSRETADGLKNSIFAQILRIDTRHTSSDHGMEIPALFDLQQGRPVLR